MSSRNSKSGPSTVVASALLSTQFLLCRPKPGCVRLKEARGLDAAAVTARQKSLQAKIVPDGFTLSGYEVRNFLGANDTKPIVSARIPLDRHSLDRADKGTMGYILVVFAKDGDMVIVMELIAGLFQSE